MGKDIFELGEEDISALAAGERVVAPSASSEDAGQEQTLRPQTLSDYIGQEKAKENLRVCIDAARARGDLLDHVLLYGPPGLGKTTLATIIANEMGVNIRVTSGPAIERAGDLLALLTNMEEGDVLFIDEIHRLPRTVEEYLYPAMEDFAIDLILGKGPSARSMRMQLQKFTLVGATTRAGQITKPLRDRFGVVLKLDLYTPQELSNIVKRSARILGVPITEEGALEIASRARGTPRVANRLLRRVRDYAEVKGDGKIDRNIADYSLRALGIDELGIDDVDRRILRTIIESFDGGPVGIDTLAAAVGEEAVTIEDLYEPYLMQVGFLNRTPRGRYASPLAYDHLGIPRREKPLVSSEEGGGENVGLF